MTEKLYELIFSGELVSGMEAEKIQANVAQLFKASPAQIAHLFSGKRVVLKNSLPLDTGKKYLAALKKAGALCQLVDMQTGETYPPVQATPAAEVSGTAPEPQQQASAPTQPTTQQTATSEPAAPASGSSPAVEPGSEHRVCARPDLDAPAWDVAPSGSRMEEEKEELPVPEPDTDYLSLAPQKGNIVEPDNTPPPPAPDTSHLNLVEESDKTSNDR